MKQSFIPSQSTIRLVLPSPPSSPYLQAADIFERELLKRLDVDVRTVHGSRLEGDSALDVYLGTPETLPRERLDDLDAPLTLLPFPDYAERINLRAIDHGTPPIIIIACGSDSALLCGIGAWMRHLEIWADGFAYRNLTENLQPLTPVRGMFYANTSDSNSYFTYSSEQWKTLITDDALWGNNTVGTIPVHFPEWPDTLPWPEPGRFLSPEWQTIWETHWARQCEIGETIQRLGLKSLIRLSYADAFPARIEKPLAGQKEGELDCSQSEAKKLAVTECENLLSRLPLPDAVWFSAHSSPVSPFVRAACNPGQFLEMAKSLNELLPSDCELWLGSGGFSDEELAPLFDRLSALDRLPVRGAICGPEIGPHETVKRELPLDRQLMTMTPLSRAVRTANALETLGMPRSLIFSDDTPLVFPTQLARQFVETAPMTYGALGFSTGAHDEIHRYLWTAFAWSPQPSLEVMLESYGRWYFGADAAPHVRDALLSLESCWKTSLPESVPFAEDALTFLDRAESAVPPRMNALAKPRLQQLRLRALMDTTLGENEHASRHQIDTMLERLGKPSEADSTEATLQSAFETLKQSPYDGLETRFQQLTELRQAVFKTQGIHIQAVDRLLEPEPDRNWAIIQIDRSLRTNDKTKQRETIEVVISALKPRSGSEGITIDCGNPENDRYRTKGRVYHLRAASQEWRSAWHQIALSREQGEPVEYVIPLNGQSFNRVAVTYVTTPDIPLKQSLRCNGVLLHDTMEIPPDTPIENTYTLPSTDKPADSLTLIWRPEPGYHAGVVEIAIYNKTS